MKLETIYIFNVLNTIIHNKVGAEIYTYISLFIQLI